MSDDAPREDEQPRRRRRRRFRSRFAEQATPETEHREEQDEPVAAADDEGLPDEAEDEELAEAEAATEVLLESDDEAEGQPEAEAEEEPQAEEQLQDRLDEEGLAEELEQEEERDEGAAAEQLEEDQLEEQEAEEPGEEPGRRRRFRRGTAAPAQPAPRRRRRARDPNLPPPVVRAQAKYVRSSARKARLVCDHIRGRSVEDARAILAHTPRAVARDWTKLLESAVANAEHNHELVGEDLYVMAVSADEGPTIKRFRPRARGRATRIRKRTSHLTILLTPKD